jgi:hypothetical protein
MDRREFIALLSVAAAAMPSSAGAKPDYPADSLAGRLIGTWSFIASIDTRKDGTTFNRWGEDARGVLMIDGSGHFSQIIMGLESRLFGAKTFCAFGGFSVDDAAKALITRIEGSSISKIAGTTQRRLIQSLTPNELTYINPITAAGTKAEVKWKRLG